MYLLSKFPDCKELTMGFGIDDDDKHIQIY